MRIEQVFFVNNQLLRVAGLWILTLGGCTGWADRSPAERTASDGGSQYTLTQGEVSITVDAGLGGRIVGFSWKDDQILLRSVPDLPNFGSTFWTAPQSRWGWPPYDALHTAPYQVTYSDDRFILTGPIGKRSGYQAIKTIRPDSAAEAFTVQYTLVNHADTLRSVGPWEVTAVPAGGLTFFRKDPKAAPLPQSTLSFPDTLGVSFLYYPSVDTTLTKGKLFAFAQDGWLAHVTAHRKLFVKQFASVPPDRIAPGQGAVEVYINTRYGYMELENHGPYHSLAPGERMHYRVRWFLRELPEDIPADRISPALINCVEEMVRW